MDEITFSRSQNDIRWATHLALFLTLMLLAISVRGYAFARGDFLQFFPTYLRMFDSSYLVGDWVLEYRDWVNHRYLFGLAVGLPAQVIGWPAAAFLVFLTSWFLIYHGIVEITRTLSRDRRWGYVAAALLIVVLDTGTLGKASYGGAALQRELARGLALCGLSMWLKERWSAGGALFAAATIGHILAGGQIAGVASGALLVYGLFRNIDLRGYWRGVGVMLALAGPYVLWLAWQLHFRHMDAQAGETALQIFFLRFPIHFLPLTWPLWQYLMQAAGLTLFVWAWWRFRLDERAPQEPFDVLMLMAVFSVAWMGAYTIFSGPVFWPSILKLEAFHLAFVILLLSAVGGALLIAEATARTRGSAVPFVLAMGIAYVALSILGHVLTEPLRLHLYALRWPVVLASGVLATGVRRSTELRSRLVTVLMIAAAFGCFGAVVVILFAYDSGAQAIQALRAGFIPERLLRLSVASAAVLIAGTESLRTVLARQAGKGLVVSILVLGAAVAVSASQNIGHSQEETHGRFEITGPHLSASDSLVVTWLRANTPENAIILTPPMGETWLVLGLWRSTVFNFKSMPEESPGAVEWFRRMQRVTGDSTTASEWPRRGFAGHDPWLNDQYCARSSSDIVGIASEFGASWVVWSRRCAPLELPLAYENGHWRVYRVPANDAMLR